MQTIEKTDFKSIEQKTEPINIPFNWTPNISSKLLEITFFETDNMLHECRLTIETSFLAYQNILHEQAFNCLSKALPTEKNIDSNIDKVLIDLRCKPEIVLSIMEQFPDVIEISKYLKSSLDVNSELFNEKNWYASGFKTLWSQIGSDFTKGNIRENLLNFVVSYFNYNNIQHVKLPGKEVLMFKYKGSNGTWDCYTTTFQAGNTLFFYSVFPVSIPEKQRNNALQLINKLNSSYITGRFELETTEGELHYTSILNFGESEINEQLFSQLIADNVVAFDNFYPMLLDLIREVPFDAILNKFS